MNNLEEHQIPRKMKIWTWNESIHRRRREEGEGGDYKDVVCMMISDAHNHGTIKLKCFLLCFFHI